FPPGPEGRSRNPHLPGDPHPPERRARRAGIGPRSRGARAEARRPPGGGHLPQPRRPDREALLPRAQWKHAGRLAPSPGDRRSERADLRACRQARRPFGARACRQPPRALGAPPFRRPYFCSTSQGTPAMSNRSFRSVFMVASCAGAALGCYMVSLRVASERSQLEAVETRIVLAQRDMRVLQTEIGTRGRLSQLERWNAGAFALAAPSA